MPVFNYSCILEYSLQLADDCSDKKMFYSGLLKESMITQYGERFLTRKLLKRSAWKDNLIMTEEIFLLRRSFCITETMLGDFTQFSLK